jgi:hypothetical protein
MNADTFVEQLWSCAPPVEQLMSVGLDPIESSEFQLRNRAELKCATEMRDSNVLIDLVNRYDVSRVEIGIVRFDEEVFRTEGWWQVGKVEVDPLVVNKVTGEIEVRDLADETVTLWRCAANSAFFLEAMLRAGCFLGRTAYDLLLSDDQAARCAEAIVCAEAAGGNQYGAFYNALLGCDF